MRLRILSSLLFIVTATLLGCGESTQDKMMRVAQERAARNRAAAAAEKEEEKANTADKTAEKPAEADPKPVEKKQKKEPPAAKQNATPAKPETEKAMAAKRDDTESTASKPDQVVAEGNTLSTPPRSVSDGASDLPARDQLLTFSRLGQVVAYTGTTQSIGVYDVQSKQLVRQVFNPDITPFSMSLNEDASRLVVGGLDGTFKVFPLDQEKGLDRFQQARQLRRDAQPPRKGHDAPVTATAINRNGELVATADSQGMLKLWSSQMEEPLKLSSDATSIAGVKTYQNDQLVLAAAQDRRLLFWSLGKKQLDAREFPSGKLPAEPTAMLAGFEDKGFFIGDASGQVSMWLPKGKELVRETFSAHSEPILSMGLINNGSTLLTACRNGELFRWQLPISPEIQAKLVEPSGIVAVSPSGDFVGMKSGQRNLDIYRTSDGKPVRRYSLPSREGVISSATYASNEQLVAIGDDQGRIQFYNQEKKLVAAGQFADKRVVSMDATPLSVDPSRGPGQLVAAAEDGEIIGLDFPSFPRSAASVTAKLAAADASGDQMIAATGKRVTYLRDGEAIRSIQLESGDVTSIAMDQAMALIGASDGKVWSWQASLPQSQTELVAASESGAPIVAVGATADGRIWFCDQGGQHQLISLRSAKQTQTGNFDGGINSVASNSVGRLAIIDKAGKLKFAESLEAKPEPAQSAPERTYTSVRASGVDWAAGSSDGKYLDWFTSSGVYLGSLQQSAEAQFDALTTGQNMVGWVDAAGAAWLTRPPQPPRRLSLMESTPPQRCLISSSGDAMLVRHESGWSLIRSDATSEWKAPEGKRPVGFASDGEGVLILDGDGNADVMSISSPNNLQAVGKLPATARVAWPIAGSPQWVVWDQNGSVQVLDPNSGTPTFDSGDRTYQDVSVNGDQVCLLTNDGKLQQLIAATNQVTELASPPAKLNHIAVAASGGWLVGTDDANRLYTLNYEGNLVGLQSLGEARQMVGMQVGPDGEISMLTVQGDVWKASGLNAGKIANGETQSFAISGDANWAILVSRAGDASTISLAGWQPSGANNPIKQPLPPFPSKIVSVTGLPDSNAFAIAMQDGKLARLSPAQRDKNALIELKEPIERILPISGDQVIAWPKSGAPSLVQLNTKDVVAAPESVSRSGVSIVRAAIANNTSSWAVIQGDGRFETLNALVSGGSEGQYSLSQPITDVVIRSDVMVASTQDGAMIRSVDSIEDFRIATTNAAPTAVAVSPNGKLIATCDRIGQLVAWDPSGQQVNRSQLPVQNVTQLMWSSDGETLLAVGAKRLIVIEPASGRLQSQLMLPAEMKQLVSWSETGIRYIDPTDRLQIMTVPTRKWSTRIDGTPVGVVWSADAKQIVVATESGTLVTLNGLSGTVSNQETIGNAGIRQLVGIGSGRQFAVLTKKSEIYLYNPGQKPQQLGDSSALGLRGITADPKGQWLYQTNDLGQVTARNLGNPESPVQGVPCSIDASDVVFAGRDRLVVTSQRKARFAILDGNSRRDQVDRTLASMTDAGFLPDGSFAVIANGTRRMKMVPLRGGEMRWLEGSNIKPSKLDVHPTGVRVAAVGANADDESRFGMAIFETVTQKPLANVPLDSPAQHIAYSPDGGLVAISLQDGSLEVYDGATGELLEALPANEKLQTFSFSSDGSQLLLAVEGGEILVQPISALGQTRASEKAIVSLSFHGGDRYLMAASTGGEISIWNRAALKSPQARLAGFDAPIRTAQIAVDGSMALASYDDDKHSTCVWSLKSLSGAREPVKPELVIESATAPSASGFTADAKFLLVGGQDGMIRAWSVAEKREVARFEGHSGAVAAIAPLDEKGRFVSGGIDRSIRSWRFPGSLPAPGAEIPEGGLADATEVYDLEPPDISKAPEEEDPWDAARQALIAGTETATDNAVAVLDLIEGNETAKAAAMESLNKILSMEQSGEMSASELSTERRRLAASRRQIVVEDQARIQGDYAGGFSNLFFAAQSNFKFGLQKTFRPVELLFADRFLYAARPAIQGPGLKKRGGYRNVQETRDIAAKKTDTSGNRLDENGKPIRVKEEELINIGDNGALLSWDYRYSQLQAHAWSIEDLKVSKLYAMPHSAGVFSAPDVMLFNQDGTSRRFPTANTWATTRWKKGEKQYLAIGSAGGNRIESDVLKIFEVSELLSETPKPASQYRSFEGIVTAMAYANKHTKIAFAIRERSVHRLFVADVETMKLDLIEEHAHQKAWLEEKNGVATRNTDASEGITSIAFSPDDELLIAHGDYGKNLYRFTGWRLDDELKLALTKPQFQVENKKEPFFQKSQTNSIWFINSSRRGDKGPDYVSRIKKILVRRDRNFAVVNLSTGNIEREFEFLRTLHGKPVYNISENGRWLAMGDDRGMAYLYDAITGERFCVTTDEETEARLKVSRSSSTEIPERPAHTGPVVGIALSPPDPGKEYPAFVATYGEENKVKVWEMFPVIELQSQVLRPRDDTAQTVARRASGSAGG